MSVRFGRYELVRPLGRGGMAEVFLARFIGPEGFEKRLVIKRVLSQYADDPRLLRMFFEEARTHVSLSHGNLVSVFDFGRVGDEYFIAMEHVRGADLAALLSAARLDGAPLPPSVCAYIGMEVCRGLAYVHRRAFVHRDVSPRNLLLSVDGEVKLSDFGLVLNAARSDAPGVRGTLAYTSPEQARSERVDGRSDLYSLGVVLAEALSGRRQREASDDQEALALACAGAPVEIGGPLAEVVRRATQTRPEDRFASADEMLTALEREAAALPMGREASVKELADRIGALAPAEAPLPPAEAPVSVGATDAGSHGETYYRDNASASFVDEVLGKPRPRRRVVPWLLAGAATLVMGAGVAWQATRSSASPAPPVAAPPAPVAAAPAPAPSPSPSPSPSPVAPPRRHTPTVARPAAPRPTPATAPPGTLTIQCSPWCIPSVDGTVRGPDRKNHTLALPAGRHRVEVRRLDDRLERVVEIRAGQTATETFDFK